MTKSNHDALRVFAIMVNAVFAVFLYLFAVVWGAGGILADGLIVVFPPTLAIVALVTRPTP